MPKGNCSRRVAEPPYRVKFFPRQGYAVVNEVGLVVGGFNFDQSRVAVACAAKIEALERAAKVITRPCLRCGKPFESQGIHNRMCGNCRQASSAEGEPVGYSFGAMTGRRK